MLVICWFWKVLTVTCSSWMFFRLKGSSYVYWKNLTLQLKLKRRKKQGKQNLASCLVRFRMFTLRMSIWLNFKMWEAHFFLPSFQPSRVWGCDISYVVHVWCHDCDFIISFFHYHFFLYFVRFRFLVIY